MFIGQIIWILSLVGIIGINHISPEELSTYRDINLMQSAEGELLPDASCSNPKLWKLSGEDQIIQAKGINQTSALVCHRENSQEYNLSYQEVRLTPGKPYRFGVWLKTDQPLSGEGASVCMELYSQGQYVTGKHAKNVVDAPEWQWIEDYFVVPENAVDPVYRFICYLRPGTTGTAYFDDGLVEEIPTKWVVSQAWPTHGVIYSENGEIRFTSLIFGNTHRSHTQSALNCHAQLIRNNEIIASQTIPFDNKQILEFSFGPQSSGPAEVKLFLIDMHRKEIIFHSLHPVTIQNRITESSQVFIDKNGRTIINGKPFMPIGLYMHYLPQKDLDIIAESPFNTVMPYRSIKLSYSSTGQQGIKQIREVLDYCENKDLKVIFSLKDIFPKGVAIPFGASIEEWNGLKGCDVIVTELVNNLKDHPAVLAWYTCDESHNSYLDILIARRQLINQLDPHHPCWSVFCYRKTLSYYLPSVDILGIDPYPITRNENDNMNYVEEMASQAESFGMPLWTVPQIHNIGVYDSAVLGGDEIKFYQEYPYPSEHQILAIVLREVIAGAKGFIFYSYFDLFRGPDKKQFERRWPEICRVAAILKNLEPFIMADTSGPSVTIESIQGIVRARCLSDDSGHFRLIVTGNGPKTSEAIISLPEQFDFFQSTTGNTENLGHGRYRFTGKNISCDLLIGNALE